MFGSKMLMLLFAGAAVVLTGCAGFDNPRLSPG